MKGCEVTVCHPFELGFVGPEPNRCTVCRRLLAYPLHFIARISEDLGVCCRRIRNPLLPVVKHVDIG